MSLQRFVGSSDPLFFDFEETDDILRYNPPTPHQVLDRRLDGAPWLSKMLNDDWPGHSDSPLINAHSAAAWIILVVWLLDSQNPEDIAYATGIPKVFILLVLLALKRVAWNADFISEVKDSISDAQANPLRLRSLVTEFLSSTARVDFNFFDLLRVTGLALE